MGVGGNAEFTKLLKGKGGKNQNRTWITNSDYKSEFSKAELSANQCRTLHFLLGIYFYLFCRCYFFQIFTDDFLKTHWQQARVSLSASYLSVLQTEKWKKREERWMWKGGLYSHIIYAAPLILAISLLPSFITSPSSNRCGGPCAKYSTVAPTYFSALLKWL